MTRIRTAWPPRTAPEPTYVDDRLNYWADADPEGEALTYGDRTWTWGQAHDRVHRGACALREIGVARGDVVAYVGAGHPASVEVTLAAGSIGAATAVVDGTWDADAVADVLAAVGAKVVVADAALADTIESVRARIPSVRRVVAVTPDGAAVDEYEDLLAGSNPCDDGLDVVEDDVCLILHPDGPGGTPVRLTQHDVVSGAATVDSPLLQVLARIHSGEPSSL